MSFFKDSRERFGIGHGRENHFDKKNFEDFDFEKIPFSWYSDWWFDGLNPDKKKIKYCPLVGGYSFGYKFPTEEELEKLITQNPDTYPEHTLWFIGNEIGYDDRLIPSEYAEHYHYYYSALKKINPTYRVSFGAAVTEEIFIYDDKWNERWRGFSEKYIREVFEAYAKRYGLLQTDCFNLHAYVRQNPLDVKNFENFIRDFRKLMKSLGHDEKLLIISEFGVLDKDVPEEKVKQFMYECLDYMMTAKDEELGCPADDYRLAQKWAWFAFNEGGEANRNTALFDSNKKITPLGEAYAEYISNLNPDGTKKLNK